MWPVSLEYNLKVWQACPTTTSTASSAPAVSVPPSSCRLCLRGGRPSLAAQGGIEEDRKSRQSAQQRVRDTLSDQRLRECRSHRGKTHPYAGFLLLQDRPRKIDSEYRLRVCGR
jgi:hypothetical protein